MDVERHEQETFLSLPILPLVFGVIDLHAIPALEIPTSVWHPSIVFH